MLTTFPRLLLKHAAERASAPAMREKEYGIWQTHSWADMATLVERVACGLHQAGLRRGEHIVIVGANRPRLYATMLAAQSLGAIPVPLYQDAVAAECVFPINNAEVRFALVEDQEQVDKMLEIRESCPQLSHIFFDDPRGLRNYDEPGLAGLDELIGAGEAFSKQHPDFFKEEVEKAQADDVAAMFFTSGTTGNPKGATLTHHNILNNGFFIGEAMKLTPQDKLCIPVPLYHCFGMVLGNLACLTHNTTIVYPCEGFDPLAVLQCVSEERCTGLHGVPTMFIAELDHPEFDTFDLSSLRTGIMAGSPCPIEVMRRVIDRMNLSQITIAYGMTETSPVSFQSGTDDPLERRVATVGRIMPHVEVKIVDSDGRIVPRGTAGELLTRGYSVMLGYWGDEEKTREAIDAAGWMHTGDLATIDDEGYCNIVGRIKDLVIRGGENVYPREIEEFLYKHPKVQDVQVVGVPDTRFGEELCAWIMLRPGETATVDEIKAFCQGQIAHYKIPRYVKFVDAFPMTVTGKVQKFVIRDQMKAELNLSEAKTA